ncbi:hypothetical protein CR513_34733, partial [Mucuna pruriens]
MKRCNLAFDQVSKERKLQLQELEELHLEAYENSKIYKENVKGFHDNMILRKEFKLIVGKLHSKWDGPFLITNAFSYGAIEIRNEATNKTFKVNRHQRKLFHKCPTMMEGDVKDLSLVKPTLLENADSLSARCRVALDRDWSDMISVETYPTRSRLSADKHNRVGLTLFQTKMQETGGVVAVELDFYVDSAMGRSLLGCWTEESVGLGRSQSGWDDSPRPRLLMG